MTASRSPGLRTRSIIFNRRAFRLLTKLDGSQRGCAVRREGMAGEACGVIRRAVLAPGFQGQGRGVKIFLLSGDEVILSGVTLVWLSTDCTAASGKPNAMHARHVGY